MSCSSCGSQNTDLACACHDHGDATSENLNGAGRVGATPTWVSAPSTHHYAPTDESEYFTKKPLRKKKVVWAGAALVVLVGVAVVAKSRRDKGSGAARAVAARDHVTALARDRAVAYLAQVQNAVPNDWPTVVRSTLSSMPLSKKQPVRRAMSFACHVGKIAKSRRSRA